jgi:ribonuclease T2
MMALWPDLKGSNFGFWSYEWIKHGTCTTFPPHDYFQTTCGLTLRIGDLLVQLQNNGLIATHCVFSSSSSKTPSV